MKWRLAEGGGQATYEIGVADDGTLSGLSAADLEASLVTLSRYASTAARARAIVCVCVCVCVRVWKCGFQQKFLTQQPQTVQTSPRTVPLSHCPLKHARTVRRRMAAANDAFTSVVRSLASAGSKRFVAEVQIKGTPSQQHCPGVRLGTPLVTMPWRPARYALSYHALVSG